MTNYIPEQGRPWDDIREEMQGMRGRDLDWRHGRHGAYVWYAGDDLEDVLREAYGMFLVENGLGIRVFPSIQRMEAEVLATAADLLSAPEGSAGIFTSGGTESIFLAIYAAREWARATLPDIAVPEFVAPHSAHPALNKAAHLLGMTVTRVPVGPDFRADPAALEAAISPSTIGIYCSAPTYSLGLVDPVPAISEVAAARGLWLHVDACVGGILAPSVRELGYAVPPFDFANAGVTSISADLHKSGFLAKPASTVTFRTAGHHAYARYRFDDWPSGLYQGFNFTGSRPGGPIAAAWAGQQFLGREGYRRLAASSMRTKEALITSLGEIPGFRLHGQSDLWSFAFALDGVAAPALAGAMFKRGWVTGVTTSPAGIHVMPTPVHEPFSDEYVHAIRECAAEVQAGSAPEAAPARYN
ncbi:MAG: aspartate aminotransferase family protein [Dehalococcoidia bacterium]|nr:aspartate aminotransferase family protein [Dehalococcoidia bacterium]MCB9484921.1 aspartate aminotransferase family protein [Thermoflexaceae bacterium]